MELPIGTNVERTMAAGGGRLVAPADFSDLVIARHPSERFRRARSGWLSELRLADLDTSQATPAASRHQSLSTGNSPLATYARCDS